MTNDGDALFRSSQKFPSRTYGVVRFHIQTFGCKSNQYESQGMIEALTAAGFVETARLEDAAIVIVNTCAVTGRAGAACRSALRKAVRVNPRARAVIVGCGVDVAEAWPDLPSGPPLLIPNAEKHTLPVRLAHWLARAPSATREAAEARPAANRFGLAVSSFQGHTRAFLKIQDGCDTHCSYCIIPRARGKPESRPIRDILDEAARLTDNGYRELVLTGINIGAYRNSGRDLADLAGELARTPGLLRLRLGSVEPPYLDERLVGVMRDEEKICPHVHLPLQSGDDRILAAMNRRYDVAAFLEKTALLASFLPLPAVTTDVIVGFPGEDGASAAKTRAVCRRAGFSRLHVFPFSPRPGTPAANMPRTAPEREVEEWKTALIALGKEISEQYAAACVGLEELVIVEASKGPPSGHSDRYVRTILDEKAGPPGTVRRVRIAAATGAALVGRPLADTDAAVGDPA